MKPFTKATLHAVLLLVFGSLIVSPAATASFELFPKVEGMRWRYATEIVPANDPYDQLRPGSHEMRIHSIRRADVATVFVVRELDSYTGRYRFSEWEVSDAGVEIRGIDFPGPLSEMIEGLAFEFFRLPLEQGRKSDDGNWITEVKGRETVSVPGLLDPREAWRLYVIGTNGPRYTAVGSYWIVPGWGIVKSSINAQGWLIEATAIERSKE